MATPDKLEPRRRAERLAGFVVYAATLVGMASLAFGFIAVLSGNWEASGTFFIGAAIAFGALANAILRD
jgi:hypothetical protein